MPSRRARRGSCVRVLETSNGQQAVVDVIDEGPGIPNGRSVPDLQPILYDAGERAPDSAWRSPIASCLTHGGTIQVERDVPARHVRPDSPARLMSRPSRSSAADVLQEQRMTDRRTVLLVDDDPSFRRVVEYQLQEDGYRVLTAPSAASALQQFQGRGDRPRV